MTPEETKHYIEERLNALGWAVHIGTTGYEKIFRFTEGNEDGARRLYHKLLALGGLQDTREINDDLLDMAMIDLAVVEAPIGRAVSEGDRRSEPVPDLASIEQLAAVLEAKMADAVVEEVRPPKERTRARDNAAPERPKPAVSRPKALVVEPAPGARARIGEALAIDFTVIEAADGEEAWKLLLERSDVEIMITGLALPTIDGSELIRRVRGTPRAHLAALPVIAVGTEDAGAKLRALAAGANDFVVSDAPLTELRTRALSRHRLGRSLAQANRMRAEARATGEARIPRAQVSTRRSVVTDTAAGESVLETFSAEPRFPRKDARGSVRNASGATRESVIRQLYRISSTTTITLSATALLAIAIITILYIGRSTTEGTRMPTAEPLTGVAAPTVPKEQSPINTPPPAVSSDSSPREETDGTTSAVESETPVTREPSPPPATAKAPERPSPAPRPSHRNDNAQPDPGNRPAAKTSEERPAAPEPEPESKPDARTDVAASAPARVTPPAPTKPEPSPPTSAAAPSKPEANAPVSPAAPSKPEASTPANPTAPPTPSPSPNADTTARAVAPEPDVDATESGNARAPTAVRPGTVVPAPATPTPPPAATKISRDELSAFLRRFAAVYETGDAEQFVGLFADNARTNDRIGRKGIRDDYETLFRSTDMRRMNLGQMSWEIDGNQAYGWGDFDVTVRRATDRETYAYSGSMTFVLEKMDGRIRIVRLYHDQRRIGARG
ncbi:MAG: response regulator [Sulfurifustaceae bacterium]